MLEKEFIFEKKYSVAQMRSGDLKALSTSSMITFMENATVGNWSTNSRVVILLEQKKKIFIYEVEGFEGESLIGNGEHTRAVVDAEKLWRMFKDEGA